MRVIVLVVVALCLCHDATALEIASVEQDASRDADPSSVANRPGNARPRGVGFLTSVQELAAIREASVVSGTDVKRKQLAKIVQLGNRSWPFGDVGTSFGVVHAGAKRSVKRCVRLDDPNRPRVLPHVAEMLFSKVLAYHLSNDQVLAVEVRRRLLELASSRDYERVDGSTNYTGANQCALELGLSLPLLIESAILLESWPGWSDEDRLVLQRWLAGAPYRLTSAIAATRKNNWGNGAAFASWAIAHYLSGSGLRLEQVYPERTTRTPKQAKRAHLDDQLRLVGDGWRGDSHCNESGVQWHGGIPDELRRGSTECDGTWLREDDASLSYQIMAVAHLVFHAEALARLGGNELYELMLGSGEPLIRRAIEFVIDNPTGRSRDWKLTELGVLRLASHAYPEPVICRQLDRSNSLHEGYYLPFIKVLRPEVCP